MRNFIYHSDTAKVFSVGELAGRDVCVTFFTYASKEETLPLVGGFAEAALARRGISTLHFVNLQNHWWQIADLEACLDAAQVALAGARRRTGYGSSMGAYAALRFSQRLGLDRILAFVPQFSIDRQRVPFETRWQQPAQRLTFAGEPYRIDPATQCHVVVGDDPRDLEHIRLIQSHNRGADLTVHRVDGGKHLILKDYQDRNILGGIVASLPDVDVAGLASHPAYRGSDRIDLPPA